MVKSLIEKTFNIIFFLFSIIIFSVALIKGIQSAVKYAVLLFIPALVSAYFIVKRIDFKNTTTYSIVWMLARLISATVMIYLMVKLVVSIGWTWDWGAIIGYAHQYVTKGVIKKPSYFAQYPNNLPWFTVMLILAKIAIKIFPNLTASELQILSSGAAFFLIQISISFIHKAAELLWNKRTSFFVGIVTLLCIPIYLYAQYFYTDIPTFLCVSISLYLIAKIGKAEKKKDIIILCVLLGAIIAISTLIKVTSIILLFALFITILLSKSDRKKSFAIIVSLALTFVCVFIPINNTCKRNNLERLNISDEMIDKYEFPFTHWIMMGLGVGNYSQEDVDYTASFNSIDEKKSANIDEIKKRISNYGVTGLIHHLYYDKLGNTFGNSCLFGDHYVSKNPINQTLALRIFSKNGDLHKICLYYSWIYHLSMLFGVVLSSIFALYHKRSIQNKALLFARITIFGFGMFMLIWECNSRYLLMYLPLMIFMSIEGLKSLNSYLNDLIKPENIKRNKSIPR